MAIIPAYLQPGARDYDLADVRATTAIVRTDKDEVADAPLDVGAMPIDPNIGAGLTSSYKNSPYIPPRRLVPIPLSGVGDAIQREINDGQTTKGAAVAKASAGDYGSNTLGMSFGIDPIVNVGTNFGPQYFDAGRTSVLVSEKLGPLGLQTENDALAAAAAVNNSRAASQPSPYAAFLQGE